LLKPELLRAISDLGFEHPSEGTPTVHCRNAWSDHFSVQQECIPQAVLGMDVLCQAKSGHGKTAVFVLATLQQLEPVNGEVSVLVLCHTRELAFQIKNEYTRFAKYMPDVRVSTFFGGTPVAKDAEILRDKTKCPHIVVATPGRLNALARDKVLDAKNVKHFVLDECEFRPPLQILPFKFRRFTGSLLAHSASPCPRLPTQLCLALPLMWSSVGRTLVVLIILFLVTALVVDRHLITPYRPPDMRRDVQEIFRATPHHKQVMMFSATLSKEIRVTCKKFMATVCPVLFF
jgi:hypothetical protein